MYTIDLNCDLGESFGNYKCGMDTEVLPFISSANVACGFHASDPLVMWETVKLSKKYGVCIGAHPGYPDLVGFGRRNMAVTAKEVKAMVQYQIGALNAFCHGERISLCHVKPHGAMYNMAAKNGWLARAICEGIWEADSSLILMGMPGSEMEKAAEETGITFAREVFADRAYEEDGSLVPRSRDGAMITDEKEAIERVISMIKEGKVRAVTGKDMEVEADSVCIHGDNPQALAFAEKIKQALEEEQIKILPLKEILGNRCI